MAAGADRRCISNNDSVCYRSGTVVSAAYYIVLLCYYLYIVFFLLYQYYLKYKHCVDFLIVIASSIKRSS